MEPEDDLPKMQDGDCAQAPNVPPRVLNCDILLNEVIDQEASTDLQDKLQSPRETTQQQQHMPTDGSAGWSKSSREHYKKVERGNSE